VPGVMAHFASWPPVTAETSDRGTTHRVARPDGPAGCQGSLRIRCGSWPVTMMHEGAPAGALAARPCACAAVQSVAARGTERRTATRT
jgi:hypothetical protein